MRRTPYIGGALLALLWMTPLQAQGPAGTISGRVTDQGTQEPLAGVTVTAGNRGTLTKADGRYTMTVPAGAYEVRTRMIGYAPATRSITVVGGQAAVVDLALTAQAIALSEVIVTGYGEQRAGDITGAVKQIAPEEFNTGRIVSPEQLIQSKVAGAQIVDNNEPGGYVNVRIRGATSVNASSEPLYVIDGMPIGTGAGGGLRVGDNGRNPLNFLNPEDIESITVLKDASSAAIYGANAANGVVLIQTKGGRRGTTQIEYTGSASVSTVTRLPDMLTADEFRTAVQTYAPTKVAQLGSANTDWFGQVDRSGFGQEHNLAVSGSGERMNYRLSFGYLNQNGVIDSTNTERLAMGFNYDQTLFDDRLNIQTGIKLSRTRDQYAPGGVLSNAAQFGPTQPVIDSTSKTGYYEWPGNALQSADNPVAVLAVAKDHGTTYRSVGNIQAGLHVPGIEGLKANLNLGYDVTKADRETFNPSSLHSQLKAGTGGTSYRTDQTLLNTVLETYLNYNAPLSFMPGNIDLTGGYSYTQSHGEYPSLNLQGLSTDLLGVNGVPTAATVRNFLDVQDSRLISFFGRVNYNFNDQLLLAGSLRRDGSSRFGPSNAWGVFPAASVAYRLASGSGTISDLKLRGSWGRTGNQAFGNYQQYTSYLVGDAAAQIQMGNQFITTIRPGAVDPNIKWEETNAYDVGLDYGFYGQRLSGAIDWYTKNTKDLIFTVPVAAGTNFSNFLTTNLGSMKNRGIEGSLSARLAEGGRGGFGWTADFTASHNSNELTSINPTLADTAQKTQKILTGGVAGGVGTFIQVYMPGQPISSFFVYQHKRDASGNPIYSDENGDGTINEQDLYVDLNGDGVINVADRRPFHSPDPKWILGHTSYITKGKLDFSFTLRAYLGGYVYNNVASNLGTYSEVTRASPYNLHASVLKTGFQTQQLLSDYYVEDASFLRMDNLTIGYTFQYHGQPARVSATAQSLFTLTGYSGVDPTAGLNGLDNNIYPRSRMFTAGLSVRF
jgi:iron complex outermembrane receptor protein